MQVILKPEDEQFLIEQVKTGRFGSTEDAVAEAIDRLRWAEEVEPTAQDIAAVQEGIEQLNRGEGIPWEHARRDLNTRQGPDR